METKKYVVIPTEEIQKLMDILLDPKIDWFKKTVAAANFNLDFVKGKS